MMKNLFFIVFFSIFILSCTKDKVINLLKLQSRNGIFYEINTETPFTGKVISKYPNGQKSIEANIKNGKYSGKFITWYINGQKKSVKIYKDGKLESTPDYWDENGKKIDIKNFENIYKNHSKYLDYEISIDLNIVPGKNLKIYLNNKLVKKKIDSPFLLTGLKPGKYELKVEKEGCVSIVKMIKIPKLTIKDAKNLKGMQNEKALKKYGLTYDQYLSGIVNMSFKLIKTEDENTITH